MVECARFWIMCFNSNKNKRILHHFQRWNWQVSSQNSADIVDMLVVVGKKIFYRWCKAGVRTIRGISTLHTHQKDLHTHQKLCNAFLHCTIPRIFHPPAFHTVHNFQLLREEREVCQSEAITSLPLTLSWEPLFVREPSQYIPNRPQPLWIGPFCNLEKIGPAHKSIVEGGVSALYAVSQFGVRSFFRFLFNTFSPQAGGQQVLRMHILRRGLLRTNNI